MPATRSVLRVLTTTKQVLDALGGYRAVAERFSSVYTTPVQTVHAWQQAGKFPPDSYVMLQEALFEVGCTASPSLWRMRKAS